MEKPAQSNVAETIKESRDSPMSGESKLNQKNEDPKDPTPKSFDRVQPIDQWLKKPLCLRELRRLRASFSSSGLLPPFHGRFRMLGKEKNSHGGHGVHGVVDR
jgi:hypothetical protein